MAGRSQRAGVQAQVVRRRPAIVDSVARARTQAARDEAHRAALAKFGGINAENAAAFNAYAGEEFERILDKKKRAPNP